MQNRNKRQNKKQMFRPQCLLFKKGVLVHKSDLVRMKVTAQYP